MLEHRTQPLLPRREFIARMLRSAFAAAALALISLLAGMAGYHGFERMGWLDAFLNASMIMAGMGPVAAIQTRAGKIFAGCYALYCGLALISAAAILITPLLHRLIHRFHADSDGPR